MPAIFGHPLAHRREWERDVTAAALDTLEDRYSMRHRALAERALSDPDVLDVLDLARSEPVVEEADLPELADRFVVCYHRGIVD